MSDQNTSILIGLDGLDAQEIEDWLNDGTLKNINKIAESGDFVSLQSTHPPWTPCAWPSLLSGRNPGQHGTFDFFTRDGYDKHLSERSDIQSPYLFEVASKRTRTPLVINYPLTHPASRLEHGAVVPGYLASEDVAFHPEGLRKEYEAEYGKYVIYPEYGTADSVQEYITAARCRRDMACFLDDRYDWNLLAVQFQVTDSVFHDIADRDKIRQVLKAVDGYVGDIVDLGSDATDVFIVSDHGMGDYEWTFYVNSWLHEHGYCETMTGEEQYFRQKKADLKGDAADEAESGLTKLVGTTATALSTVGLSPRRIHSALSALGLDGTVERVVPEEALVAAQNEVVDHENSTAYQLLFNSLGIHLNVEGREPNGQVRPKDYEDVREELINKLSEVRDPDGNRVFDAVQPREAVYDGPHLDDAPDIVLFPRDYQYDVSGSIVDTFRRNPHKNHKPNGILLSNRDLNVDSEHGASIYDIAPTVAAALGLPVDSKTDGKVLGPFEPPENRVDWDELAGEYRKSSESATNTDDVEERLADLGYME